MRRIIAVQRTVVVRRVVVPNTQLEKCEPCEVANNKDGCSCLILLGIMVAGAMSASGWVLSVV